ncbi:MAG: LAGLIDADG family homing endonuclease [Conexivisphaerales archaeon]
MSYSDRLEAYLMVKNSGLKDAKLIQQAPKEKGMYVPSLITIRRWIKGNTSPYSNVNIFEPKPSDSLGFFIGAWLGDGWADDSDGGKRLFLKVMSESFAKEFAEAASFILQKKNSYKLHRLSTGGTAWYQVKVTSLLLYSFLVRPLSSLKEVVVQAPKGFLRGLFTADGNPSVSINRSHSARRLSVSLCVSNTDAELIRLAWEVAESLGYHPTKITCGFRGGRPYTIKGKTYRAGSDELQFRIESITEVSRFLDEIGFADKEKQEKASLAYKLIITYGARKAAEEWERYYVKIGRKWMKREG